MRPSYGRIGVGPLPAGIDRQAFHFPLSFERTSTMTISTRSRSRDANETPRQARTFSTMKGHYLTLGLCSPCAAQAAFGHQLGFSRSNPPCDSCSSTIGTFPVREPGPWRSSSPRRGAQAPWSRQEDLPVDGYRGGNL